MKISLSQYAGFCDGVERAYEIVKKIANNPSVQKPIYVLGSLVHNDDVVRKIESLGIKKLKIEGSIVEAIERIGKKIGTLVITAHGVGPSVYEALKKKGIRIVDTTCPRVIKVQRLAKVFFERECQIVIVGERDHKEVKGIFEWASRKAQFVESFEDLKKLKLNSEKKIAVISQTTQNQDFVDSVVGRIKNQYPDVEVVDTICLTTQNRQSEVRKMARENDSMVIIGSPESANSTRLWEISKEINNQSYFVSRASEVDPGWFSDTDRVGVSAGASTPRWIIDGVLEKLKEIG